MLVKNLNLIISVIARETSVRVNPGGTPHSKVDKVSLQRIMTGFSLFSVSSERIRADGPYCHSQCPELDACINESLWCDGVEHCPSGYDESFGYCMHLLYTHLVYSIALTVAIVIVAVSSGLTVLWFRRFRSASSATAAARTGAVCARGPSVKGSETETMVAACDVVY